MGFPSASEEVITVLEAPDRPQPRLGRDTDRGHSVSVGRVRKDESGIFDIQFAALSHNGEFLFGRRGLGLYLIANFGFYLS